MKIFYIANFKDIYSKKWADYFDDNGHMVIRYHLIKPKMSDVRKVKSAIKEAKPDILHSQYCGNGQCWEWLHAFTLM